MAVPKSAQEAGVGASGVLVGSGGSGGASGGASGSFIGAADPSVMAELDKPDLSFTVILLEPTVKVVLNTR